MGIIVAGVILIAVALFFVFFIWDMMRIDRKYIKANDILDHADWLRKMGLNETADIIILELIVEWKD